MKKQFYLLGLLLFPFFIEAQNVGIGTTTPSARLQINHRSFTTVGLQLLDSFASRAGSIRFSTINNPVGMTISSFYESNFNKGHYLDINSDTAFVATFRGDGNVGLGVESPLYRLDINGDINTNGLLRLNGNAGTTGQVLTSNGGSVDPTWANAAYGNNTRFAFYGSSGSFGNSTLNLFTVYNTNVSDITKDVNFFTVNRSGLYHIEGNIFSQVDFTPSVATIPDWSLRLEISGSPSSSHYLIDNEMRRDDAIPSSYQSYLLSGAFSTEVYMIAGTTISFIPHVTASLTNLSFFGCRVNIRGHLINE